MDALSEPPRDEPDRDDPDGATPLGQLAARAVARVWPEVEELVRPIFGTSAVLASDREAPSRPTAVPAAVPAIPPAAWLSAEDVAPVLHITALHCGASRGRGRALSSFAGSEVGGASPGRISIASWRPRRKCSAEVVQRYHTDTMTTMAMTLRLTDEEQAALRERAVLVGWSAMTVWSL
jgi:hypothetical protein